MAGVPGVPPGVPPGGAPGGFRGVPGVARGELGQLLGFKLLD